MVESSNCSHKLACIIQNNVYLIKKKRISTNMLRDCVIIKYKIFTDERPFSNYNKVWQ